METTSSYFGRRLYQWLEHCDLNASQAAKLLAVSPARLHKYFHEPKLLPKTDFILGLQAHWPQLNLAWLMTGQGTMQWETPPPPATSNQGHLSRTQRLQDKAHELTQLASELGDAGKALLLPEALHIAAEVHAANGELLQKINQLEISLLGTQQT